MSSPRILALSSSRADGCGYLERARPMIENFLGLDKLKIAFIGFASVDNNYKAYADTVTKALAGLSYSVAPVDSPGMSDIIQRCDVIMTGGGNTFKLLHDLYAHGLINLISEKVVGGTPYIGWSAGSNICGRTISTTNDMPIIEPQSFRGLAFFPFQINPHYVNVTIDGFHGESRDQRLSEFVQLNPGVPVVCLPEGTGLNYEQGHLTYLGEIAGTLFTGECEDTAAVKKDIVPGEDLSYLMEK